MWKTLACVVGSLCLVNGGPVGPVCSSELNPMPNLNLQKLGGRWYEWSSYGTSAMVPPRRCLAFNFYPNEDGRTLDSLADYMLNTDGTIVASDHKQFVWNITDEVGFGNGELVTNFKLYDGSVTIKSRLVVLDTNYETYLIIYICRIIIGDVENAASESYNMGMILTRKKSYEDYVLADMNQNIDISLKINRIPRGTFKNAAQDYCEDIDFPNTMPVGVDDRQITATTSNQEATSLPEENVEDGIVEFDGTVEQLNVPEGPDKPPLKENSFSESSNSVDNSLMVTSSPGLRNNEFIHDEIALEMERAKKQNNPKENEHQVFDGLDGIASEEFIQRIKGKELLKTVEQLEASGTSYDVIKALEKISPSLTYQEEADDLIAKGGPLAPPSIKDESKPENPTENSNSSALNEPDVSNSNNQAITSENSKPLPTYTKETIPDELSNDNNKPPWKDSSTPNMADDGFNRKSKHTATSNNSKFKGNMAFGEVVSGKPVTQDNEKEKEGSITPSGSDSMSKSAPLKIEENTHSSKNDVATNKEIPPSDTQPTVEPPDDTYTQSKPTTSTLETENPSKNLSADLQKLDADSKPMDESKTTDGEELMAKSTPSKNKENIPIANNADEANEDTLSPSSIETIQNAETQLNPVHSSTLNKESQSKDLVADSTKPDANYKPLDESKTTDGSDSRPESVQQNNEETSPSKNNAPSASQEASNAETPSNPLTLSKIDKETALKNLVADAPKPDADPKALDESKTTYGSDSRSESRLSTNEENAPITNYADAANDDAANKDHAPSSSTPSSFETSNNAVAQTDPVPSMTLQKETPSKDFAVDSPKPDPDSKPLEEPKTTDSSDSNHVSLSTLEPENTSNNLEADPPKPDASSRQLGESKTTHELDLRLQSEPHKHEEITLLTNNAAAANKDNPSSGTPSSAESPINAEPKSNHVSSSTPENENSSKELAADSSKPEPDSKPFEESKTTDSSDSQPKSASQNNEKTPLSRNNAAVENKDNQSSGIPSSIVTPFNAGPESNAVSSSTLEPENTFKDLEADPPKSDADSRSVDESKTTDGSDSRQESAPLKIEETTLSKSTATAANKVTLNAETQSNSVSSSTLDKENTLKGLVADSPKPDADSKLADKSKTTDGSDTRQKTGSKNNQESIPSTNNAAAANKAIPSPGTPSSVETSGNPETKLNPVSSSALEKESLSKDLMADSAKSDENSNQLEQTKTIAETRKSDSQPKSVPKKKKKTMISTNNAATANKNTPSSVAPASVETPGKPETQSNHVSSSSSENENPSNVLPSDPIKPDADSKPLEQSKTIDGSDSQADLAPLKHIETTLSTNSAATAKKDTPSSDTPASVETPGNPGTQSNQVSSSSSEKENPSKVLASDPIKPDADSKSLEQSKTIDGSDLRADLAPLKHEETTVSTNNAVAANKNTPSPVTPASVETPGNLGTQSNHVSPSSSEKENPSKDLASDSIKPDADTKPLERSKTTDGSDSRPDLAPLKHDEPTLLTNDAVAPNKDTPSTGTPSSLETPNNSLGTQYNPVPSSSSEKETPPNVDSPNPNAESMLSGGSKTNDGSDSVTNPEPPKHEENAPLTNNPVETNKNPPIAEPQPSPVSSYTLVNNDAPNTETPLNPVSSPTLEKENPLTESAVESPKTDAGPKALDESKTTDGSYLRQKSASKVTTPSNNADAKNKGAQSVNTPSIAEPPNNADTYSNPDILEQENISDGAQPKANDEDTSPTQNPTTLALLNENKLKLGVENIRKNENGAPENEKTPTTDVKTEQPNPETDSTTSMNNGEHKNDKVMEYGQKQSTDSNNNKNNIDSNSAQHPTETKTRQNGDENQESSQADYQFNHPIQKPLDPQKEHKTDFIGDIKPELGSQRPSTDDTNSNNIKPEGAQIPPETSSPPNGNKHQELTQTKGKLNKPQVPQESPINSIDAMTSELTTKGDKTTETSQTTDLTPGSSDSSKSYLELSPKHQSVKEQALVGTSASSTTNEKSPHEAVDAKVNQVEKIDANEMRITSENKPNNNPSEGKHLNEDKNESKEKHNKEDNEKTEKSLEPSINSKDDGDNLKIPADKLSAAENDLKHSKGTTTTKNKISSIEKEIKQWEQENVPVNEKEGGNKVISEKGNTKNHQTETTSIQSSKEKDESNDLEKAKTNQTKQFKGTDKEESGRDENGGKLEMGTKKELEKDVGVDGKGQVNEQDPGNQAIKSNEQVSSTDNNASDIKQSNDKVDEIDTSSKNSPKSEATVTTKHPMGPLSAETHQVKGEPNPEQDEEEEVPPKIKNPRKTPKKEIRGPAISSASSPSKVETSLSEVVQSAEAVTEKQQPTTFSAEPSTLEKETPSNKENGATKPITPNKEKPTSKPPSPEKKTDNVLTQSGPVVASTLEKETPFEESQVPPLKQDESSPKPAIETANVPNNPNTQSEPVNPTKEESKPTSIKPTALEKSQPIIEEASTKPVAPKQDKKEDLNEHNKKSDDNKDDGNNDDDDNDDDIPPTPAPQAAKKVVRKKPVSKANVTPKKKVNKKGTATPTKRRATANAS